MDTGKRRGDPWFTCLIQACAVLVALIASTLFIGFALGAAIGDPEDGLEDSARLVLLGVWSVACLVMLMTAITIFFSPKATMALSSVAICLAFTATGSAWYSGWDSVAGLLGYSATLSIAPIVVLLLALGMRQVR